MSRFLQLLLVLAMTSAPLCAQTHWAVSYTHLDVYKRQVCMFPTVYFGRHLSIREVECFQATRLRVETETPLDVYADGEYVCQTPVEITVEQATLQVIVGAESHKLDNPGGPSHGFKI